jgi:hypothetical protein
MNPFLQAAAELERRARLTDGRVSVLFQRGEQWEYRGRLLDQDEADRLRRTYHGTLIIVTRKPVPYDSTH